MDKLTEVTARIDQALGGLQRDAETSSTGTIPTDDLVMEVLGVYAEILIDLASEIDKLKDV
jgi:hypothetical protein